MRWIIILLLISSCSTREVILCLEGCFSAVKGEEQSIDRSARQDAEIAHGMAIHANNVINQIKRELNQMKKNQEGGNDEQIFKNSW